MSNPSVVSLKLAVGVATGISVAQTPAAAGNLTITGSLASGGVATMDVARRVLATSANVGDNGKVVTITGTNGSGTPISEALTLVGGSTAFTKQDFKTVIQASVAAAFAGNVSLGTNNVGSTPWVLDSFLTSSWNLAIACHIKSGAATYTVEHTYDDPNTGTYLYSSMEVASFQPPIAWANPTLQAFTTDGEFQYSGWPVFAHRLTITAGQGEVALQSIQSGLGNS